MIDPKGEIQMKTRRTKRLLSFLLMLSMLLSLLPASVSAQTEANEEEAVLQTDESTTEIMYSDLSLSFDPLDGALAENSGETVVTLRRGGDVSQALTLTLLVYDNNANYGEDYCLYYDGEPLRKIDGARSIYDAFRDEGALNEGWTPCRIPMRLWSRLRPEARNRPAR